MSRAVLTVTAVLLLAGCASTGPGLGKVDSREVCVTVSLLPEADVADVCRTRGGIEGIVFGCYDSLGRRIWSPEPGGAGDRHAWEILGHEMGHAIYGEFHE